MKEFGHGPWANKNNDTGVIAKRGKSLGKQLFSVPALLATAWAKKITPWRSPKPVQKRWETNGFCRARAMCTRE